MQIRCPHCQNPIEVVQDDESFDYDCPSCGSSFNLASDTETVSHTVDEAATIAHFRLTERLGIGKYGTVWKALDTELDRTVAVKIPRKEKLDAAEGERFLREARTAAQLKHPHIVAVHEVGPLVAGQFQVAVILSAVPPDAGGVVRTWRLPPLS